MKLPRLVVPFILGRVNATRCTVRYGRQAWILYASRGIRYVVLRLTHRDRPWVCHRISGSTVSWDRGTYAEKEDYIMGFLRKLTRPAEGAVDRPEANDPQIAASHPALHDHLTRLRNDDGSARQTCSLTLYGQAGRFKAFLNDRDSGASLGVESDSIGGLLRALEAELESDAPSWFWREGGGSHPAKNRGKRA